MSGFIPELTTRVTVETDTSELDNAISLIQSDSILSQIGLADELEQIKNKVEKAKSPLAEAIAKRLQSNQENIISSKHYITGMMANSVDITGDGEDYLVGNTAMNYNGFPYPLAIEKGSRSHWVAPVTFNALHWDGDKFSKGHMVSGITADPFVDPSIQDTIYDIEQIWEAFDI